MAYNPGTTRVDIVLANNTTWDDQFQFGYPDDQSWNLVGASFLLAVNYWQEIGDRPSAPQTPIVEFTSAAGTITVVDTTQRILAMNVPMATTQQYLPPGSYVYDLIMVNPSGTRDGLMWGKLEVVPGITP